MAGFMSKWQILVAGATAKVDWMLVIVVFAALNSVVSLGYYAPLINRMYRKETSSSVAEGSRIPVLMVIPIVFLTAAIIMIGIWPAAMDFFTEKAAMSLLYTFFN